MATKKKADIEPINPFAIFDTFETGDKFVDSGKDRPTYGYGDSGCYALNGILCGDVYGGFPLNKVVQTAGFMGSGKSLLGKYNFCSAVFAKGYFVYYIDTENETTEEDLVTLADFPRGQFKVLHYHTVEECHYGISRILRQMEEYMEKNKTLINDHPFAFVLDSQGQLSTNKAINDVLAGEDKVDLTKAKKLKAMYNDITYRLGELGVPMYVTNHLYWNPNAAQTHSDPKVVAGGEGSKYSASIILQVRKEAEKINKGATAKEGKEVTGIFINISAQKNRLVHDGFGTRLYLSYKSGLSKYYGLHVWAKEAGLIEEYSKTAFPYVEPPRDESGRVSRKTSVVIKDPKIPKEQWIAIPEGRVHTKQAIGTILDEINEYIRGKYKNQRIAVFGDDTVAADELTDADESEIDAASDRDLAEKTRQAMALAEALENDA